MWAVLRGHALYLYKDKRELGTAPVSDANFIFSSLMFAPEHTKTYKMMCTRQRLRLDSRSSGCSAKNPVFQVDSED